MPAIIDHDGEDGQPISVFESGAILLYLAAKTGMLMPEDRRGQIQVHEWLMWQMGGFGPMLGQAHHFNFYAPERIDYAMKRYSAEANRLYGVLDKRLSQQAFVAGDSYSIADISILPWTRSYARQNVDIDAYPHVKAWRKKLIARPAVKAGGEVGAEWREDLKTINSEDYAKLFGTEQKSPS
jgi:GST-like protein